MTITANNEHKKNRDIKQQQPNSDQSKTVPKVRSLGMFCFPRFDGISVSGFGNQDRLIGHPKNKLYQNRYPKKIRI